MQVIPYGTQFIDQEDIDAVIATLKSPTMTQGPKVEEFEKRVADYLGIKYAVSFSNGTAALHAAYYASGIKKGESFITSPNTFVASANGGLYVGALPKFVDIDPVTFNIDTTKIKEELTDDVKVITPVSYAGYPVDLKEIREIVGSNRVIIHDAAHAIGAQRSGSNILEYADMAMLSFHPVKHVATGEGGMIITNSKEFYDKLMSFRTHGITKDPLSMEKVEGPWYYEMQELGYNYRLTDLQSALGITQMNKLDHSLFRRNQIAQKYFDELSTQDWLELPTPIDGLNWLTDEDFDQLKQKPKNLHSYHLFPVQITDKSKRKDFFNYLRKNNIFFQVHYIPVHLQPYYKREFGFKEGDFPIAESFYASEISLPMFPTLTSEQQDYIIKKIKEFVLL